MKIAILKIGALGDVVRTTILLPALKNKYDGCKITWITGPEGYSILENNPYIDHLVMHDSDETMIWRHEKYDWLISLEDDFSSCSLATSLKSKQLSGSYLDTFGRPSYTEDLSEWFGMGILRPDHLGGLNRANEIKKRNTRTHGNILYSGLGLAGPILRPRIHHGLAHINKIDRILGSWKIDRRRPTIGLNTGAGARWKHKSWGMQQTAQLAVRLHDEFFANVILLGGPLESLRNQMIHGATDRPGVFIAPPELSTKEFLALLSKLDLMITSDSLALHLGNVVGTQLVTFFGPTSEAEIDVYENVKKINTQLPCACCYLKDCQVSPNCMESISVDRMLAEAVSMLKAPPQDQYVENYGIS